MTASGAAPKAGRMCVRRYDSSRARVLASSPTIVGRYDSSTNRANVTLPRAGST